MRSVDKEIERRNALKKFWYPTDQKCLANDELFNRREVHRRYRRLAKACHPDRQGGSETAIKRLNGHLRILQDILNGNEQTMVLQITWEKQEMINK